MTDTTQAPMLARERAAMIKERASALVVKLPADWQQWPAQRVAEYKEELDFLREAKSLNKILQAAAQVARSHGVAMSTLDPMHGQPL